jgi:hypothetical protein
MPKNVGGGFHSKSTNRAKIVTHLSPLEEIFFGEENVVASPPKKHLHCIGDGQVPNQMPGW